MDNDGEKLREFFRCALKIYDKSGYDMNKYAKLVNVYFGVGNDNVNKVQNAMIFGGTWKLQLSIETKRELDRGARIIGFDPAKFVTFLVMIENNLRALTHQQIDEGVHDYIQLEHAKVEPETYTIRNGITDSAYYLQQREFLDHSDKNIQYVNHKYMDFIYHFIK